MTTIEKLESLAQKLPVRGWVSVSVERTNHSETDLKYTVYVPVSDGPKIFSGTLEHIESKLCEVAKSHVEQQKAAIAEMQAKLLEMRLALPPE